jgi:hypothetical protein
MGETGHQRAVGRGPNLTPERKSSGRAALMETQIFIELGRLCAESIHCLRLPYTQVKALRC